MCSQVHWKARAEHKVSCRKVEDYLKETVRNRQENAANNGIDAEAASFLADNKEIEKRCESYGRMGHLLDDVISKYNTQRGDVTGSLIKNLEEDLKPLMIEWDRMGLSNTHKFHLILDHGPDQLHDTDGFADMTEDAIERNHQERARITARIIRHRNDNMKKNCQAKIQHQATNQKLKDVQNAVHEKGKRKMQRVDTKSNETHQAKRQQREKDRVEAKASLANQDNTNRLPKPKAVNLELAKAK